MPKVSLLPLSKDLYGAVLDAFGVAGDLAEAIR